MTVASKAREITGIVKSDIRFSICTLVSRMEEYQEMIRSFEKAGFKNPFCEFLYIDNSKKNTYDAYQGLNLFLMNSRAEFIILCHQDILMNYDNIEVLEKRIKEIDNLDPHWAIISNAGAAGLKNIVFRVTDVNGILHQSGIVPQKVISVDEHFILVKSSSNLALSRDLHGFHLYGTELCMVANALGYSAYIVDFNLLHKSKGAADINFFKIKKDFISKYTKAWRGRYIETTITNFYISGNSLLNIFFSLKPVLFFARQYYKMKFRKLRKL